MNPEYVERNRIASRERMRRLRAERKVAETIMEDRVGFLRAIRGRCTEDVCKPGVYSASFPSEKRLTVDGVCKPGVYSGSAPTEKVLTVDDVCAIKFIFIDLLDFLTAEAVFANQEGLDLRGRPGG